MPRIELKRGLVMRDWSGCTVALMERETESSWKCLRLLQLGIEENPLRAVDILILDEDLLKGEFVWFSESKKESAEPRSGSQTFENVKKAQELINKMKEEKSPSSPRERYEGLLESWKRACPHPKVDLVEERVEAIEKRLKVLESDLDVDYEGRLI